MVNSIHNAAQQAYLNPFQKDANQVQNRREREEETGKTQSQATEDTHAQALTSGTDTESRVETFKASKTNGQDSSRPQGRERGSIVDITV